MQNTQDISVIILTFNEEMHIKRAIESVRSFAKDIFVIDSYSTDKTVEIAEAAGAKVLQNRWVNYATQFNWAIENAPIKTKWIMRLDADEYVTDELQKEIIEKLPRIPGNITGLYIKRRVYFLGKWIRYGGIYPQWLLRIWEYGKGYCEKRWMDEHIKLKHGNTMYLNNDIVDYNLKSLSWYINKYNTYSTREAVDLINIKYKIFDYDEIKPDMFGSQEEKKRYLKEKIYSNLPLFLRPVLYFIYRYFIKLGFLDGKEGLVFHGFQGLFYRFLVDLKVFEIERLAKTRGISIQEAVEEVLKDMIKYRR